MKEESPERDPRVLLASERTLLAWIRTALALLGFGVVVARFDALSPGRGSRLAGAGLVLLGVASMAGSGAAYVLALRRLRRGDAVVVRPSWLALGVAGALMTFGVVAAMYLMAA